MATRQELAAQWDDFVPDTRLVGIFFSPRPLTMTTTYVFILCSLLASSYAQILSFPLMRRMNLPPRTLDHLARRSYASDSPLVYMYGAINTTLEYFMAIEIGSQRQLFTVQIDTGSTSTAIPGIGCMLTNSSGLETVRLFYGIVKLKFKIVRSQIFNLNEKS